MIENEFGEVGIDDALLAKNTKMQADEEIIEMMNGCICCTVRQDLIVVLSELAKRIASGKLKCALCRSEAPLAYYFVSGIPAETHCRPRNHRYHRDARFHITPFTLPQA